MRIRLINCGHYPIPIIPGVTIPHGADNIQPEEENAKAYAESQEQRRLEREIREKKRVVEMAGDAATPEDKAAVREAQAQMREFINRTGRTRRYDREQIGGTPGRNSLQSGQSGGIVRAGAVSGALDPNSERALNHAERYYEAVRHMRTDVARIADNTGFSEQQIQDVKSFVFEETHELEGGQRRFDPSYEMAESWQRLIDGRDIQPHDITLINHEMLERQLMLGGMSQDQAHVEASRIYDYAREAQAFYDKINRDS